MDAGLYNTTSHMQHIQYVCRYESKHWHWLNAVKSIETKYRYTLCCFQPEASAWYLLPKCFFFLKKSCSKALNPSHPSTTISPPLWSSWAKHDRKAGGDCAVLIWLITNLQRLILWILRSCDVRKWSCCALWAQWDEVRWSLMYSLLK